MHTVPDLDLQDRGLDLKRVRNTNKNTKAKRKTVGAGTSHHHSDLKTNSIEGINTHKETTGIIDRSGTIAIEIEKRKRKGKGRRIGKKIKRNKINHFLQKFRCLSLWRWQCLRLLEGSVASVNVLALH
jgi:hypothetical protein